MFKFALEIPTFFNYQPPWYWNCGITTQRYMLMGRVFVRRLTTTYNHMHRHFIHSSHFQLCLRTLEQKLSAYNYHHRRLSWWGLHETSYSNITEVKLCGKGPSQMLILLKHAQVHHCCAHQRQVPRDWLESVQRFPHIPNVWAYRLRQRQFINHRKTCTHIIFIHSSVG